MRSDSHRLARSIAACCVAVACAGAIPRTRGPLAAAASCDVDGIERIVAVGDVHGAYDRFVEILRAAGVVDASARWSGGKTHLVQLGDVVDRGPDSRKALDLLLRLEREAPKAGGRVHSLIGNHEALRLIGDFRYVVPGEFAAFTTPDSAAARQQAIDALPADRRDAAMQETPLGMVEMIRAFSADGPYGASIRSRDAVVRLNGVVFAHGGISPAVAAMGCKEIDDRVRRELSRDLEKTRGALKESLAFGDQGPLWYRGLAQEPESFAPELDRILEAQHARAIVIAHTVQTDGRIAVRFGGRVMLIDTGMQPAYVSTGSPSALEIRGDTFTAIYRDRRQELTRRTVDRP
jgi:hypothetical protein